MQLEAAFPQTPFYVLNQGDPGVHAESENLAKAQGDLMDAFRAPTTEHKGCACRALRLDRSRFFVNYGLRNIEKFLRES